MRAIKLATTIVFAVAIGLATTASAGNLDRPDITDATVTATDTHVGKNEYTDYSRVFVNVSVDAPYFSASTPTGPYSVSSYNKATAYGYRSISNEDGFGTFWWWIFEPDSVNRGGGADSALNQGDYLGIGLVFSTTDTYFYTGYTASTTTTTFMGNTYTYLTSTYLTYPTSVEGCKASTKVKDDGNDGGADKVEWKAQCGKTALVDNLGLDGDQQAALKRIFGSKKSVKANGSGAASD